MKFKCNLNKHLNLNNLKTETNNNNQNTLRTKPMKGHFGALIKYTETPTLFSKVI